LLAADFINDRSENSIVSLLAKCSPPHWPENFGRNERVQSWFSYSGWSPCNNTFGQSVQLESQWF